MTMPLSLPSNVRQPGFATAFVIARAAFALALHGLRHPFQPASICRFSGRVTPR